MARIEAALNNNTVTTPQPDLDRTPLSRSLLRNRCGRLHRHLHKLRRIRIPQPLLPLIELPYAQTVLLAVRRHTLTAHALRRHQLRPLPTRFVPSRSHAITMMETTTQSKMRITQRSLRFKYKTAIVGDCFLGRLEHPLGA